MNRIPGSSEWPIVSDFQHLRIIVVGFSKNQSPRVAHRCFRLGASVEVRSWGRGAMPIINRVGNVLYGVSCFAAIQLAVAGALAALLNYSTEVPISAVTCGILSVACWVWGRAMKYILTEVLAPALRSFADDAKGHPAQTSQSRSPVRPTGQLKNFPTSRRIEALPSASAVVSRDRSKSRRGSLDSDIWEAPSGMGGAGRG